MSDCPALAKAFKMASVEVHPEWARNPFHDKPAVGLADILVELQSIRDMQDSRQADILEAVRALKPAPTPGCDDCCHFADEIERLRDELGREQRASHRWCDKTDELTVEVERLQAKVADDALTIGALRDELGAARTAENIAHRVVEAQEAELKNFREREDIVLGLRHAAEVMQYDRVDLMSEKLAELDRWAKALRDFEVTP